MSKGRTRRPSADGDTGGPAVTARELLALPRRRWRFLVAVILLSLAAAASATAATPSQYRTSAMLFASAPGDSGFDAAYERTLVAQQRVKSYTRLLSSDAVVEGVVSQLGLGSTSPEEVRESLTAVVPEGTFVLEVSATASDAGLAQALANTASEQLVAAVRSLEADGALGLELVERARRPVQPFAPRPWRNMLAALLAGTVLGLGLAALRDTLDTRVNDAQAVTDELGLPLLGVVTADGSTARRPIAAAGTRRLEDLRQVRTNMQFAGAEGSLDTIVVTSSIAKEGKSVTALNVAVTLADGGRRVALVDCDLRRPSMGRYTGLTLPAGLTHVLTGQADLPDVMVQLTERLWVVTAGATPPNPSELLGSAAMQQVLAELGKDFDTVVLDTPPLLPVADAAVLAAVASGVVLVLRANVVRKEQVRRSVQALKAADARLLGCVLNGVPPAASKDNEQYGYSAGEHGDQALDEPATGGRPTTGTDARHIAR